MYRDAEVRGVDTPGAWAVLVFFTPIIGGILYYIFVVNSAQTTSDTVIECPGCGGICEYRAQYCSNCGRELSAYADSSDNKPDSPEFNLDYNAQKEEVTVTVDRPGEADEIDILVEDEVVHIFEEPSSGKSITVNKTPNQTLKTNWRSYYSSPTEQNNNQQSTEVVTPDLSEPLPETKWKKGVWIGTIGWLLFNIDAFFLQLLPEDSIVIVSIFILIWLILPVSIYMDAKNLREHSGWPVFWRMYVTASLIAFFSVLVGIFYLWMRYNISKAAQ